MSRRFPGLTPFACILTAIAGLSSCDWTGGSGSDFNTSRGGLNINLSGFYRGVQSGGRAVARTSGGQISNFTIQQSGNVLEVIDNNGQKYRGNVGSPLAVATPSTLGVIPTGAQLANFQVNWSGKDGVAAKNIQFTGVVNVVAVTDIQATIKRTESANTNTASVNDSLTKGINKTATDNGTTTTTNTESFNGTQTVATSPTTIGQEVINNTQTSTTTKGSTNVANSNAASTAIASATDSNGTSAATEQRYALGDANTQYRMRGTWIEEGGVTANVDAISPGAGGVLVVLATGQNASNITTPAQPVAPTLPPRQVTPAAAAATP